MKKNTLVFEVKKENYSVEDLKKAAEILNTGGTVIFPTETVYGLGANALDENAAQKIYEAKGRPSDNPLIVHISQFNELDKLVKDIKDRDIKLMKAFWPGPITFILPKTEIVPYKTTGGLETVAVRMPSDEIARKLIELSQVPIAGPSANISGRPSPTNGKDVVEEMSGRVDAIVVSDNSNIGLESTVVDLTGDKVMILRPGKVTKEDLESVLGEEVLLDSTLMKGDTDFSNVEGGPKSPGMKYKHYSPEADVYLVKGEDEAVNSLILEKLKEAEKEGKKAIVFCLESELDIYKGNGRSFGENLDDVAKNLFAMLRQADREKAQIVYCKTFERKGLGLAVMNRLVKAAGHKIINA